MSLKGFEKGFTNSKIASRKILSDAEGSLDTDEPGNYTRSVSLKSNTKAAVNPTTIPGAAYGMSNKGGASGDGPTPGFNGNGLGNASLNGAQGN